MPTSDAFHLMVKPTGPICNLDCSYCFYLGKEKLYPETRMWAMRGNILERYIKEYIQAQKVQTISFAWQGGESTLLGVDFFRHAVELEVRNTIRLCQVGSTSRCVRERSFEKK